MNLELADEIQKGEFMSFVGTRLRDLIGLDSLPSIDFDSGTHIECWVLLRSVC